MKASSEVNEKALLCLMSKMKIILNPGEAKSHTNEIAQKRENGLEASSEINDILITFWRDTKTGFVN